MLVHQTNLVGVQLFSYVNTFFCSNKFAWLLDTWLQTLYYFVSFMVHVTCKNITAVTFMFKLFLEFLRKCDDKEKCFISAKRSVFVYRVDTPLCLTLLRIISAESSFLRDIWDGILYLTFRNLVTELKWLLACLVMMFISTILKFLGTRWGVTGL